MPRENWNREADKELARRDKKSAAETRRRERAEMVKWDR